VRTNVSEGRIKGPDVLDERELANFLFEGNQIG